MSLRDLCLTELKLRRIREQRCNMGFENRPLSRVELIHIEQKELAE
jgi:hypothetical protein